MKPYYENKNGKLYHGDCLDVMPKLDSCDMVLTDIPYDEVNRKSNGLRNLNKKNADIKTFEIYDFLNSIMPIFNGSIYVFCGIEQVSEIRKLLVLNNLSTRLCVWEKTNPSPMNGQHIWLSGIECCVYGKKPNATFNKHCKNSVWRFPNGTNKHHPTEKPIDLFFMLIDASSNEDDLILDPCAGIGTMAVAAERAYRKWILIEKEEKYCEISAKRIEQTHKLQKRKFGLTRKR